MLAQEIKQLAERSARSGVPLIMVSEFFSLLFPSLLFFRRYVSKTPDRADRIVKALAGLPLMGRGTPDRPRTESRPYVIPLYFS